MLTDFELWKKVYLKPTQKNKYLMGTAGRKNPDHNRDEGINYEQVMR